MLEVQAANGRPAKAVPGAYGLSITGLAGAGEWMQPVPASSASLRVEAVADPRSSAGSSCIDEERADLRLTGGGRLRMRRGDPRVIFSFPEVPSDDDLLHPYLAPAAALAHMWAGREALHGGAFATPGGAVALLGEKHGGKSTTLAWLAAEHRVPVLSDDLVVLAGDSVLTGPRCLDLRPATSLQDIVLSGGRMVRKAERLRVTLPTAPAEAPLAATVVLRWGPHLRLEVAAPADRVRAVLAQRMYADRLAGDPSAILRLTSCPMVILTRPRGKSGLRDGALALLDYLG